MLDLGNTETEDGISNSSRISKGYRGVPFGARVTSSDPNVFPEVLWGSLQISEQFATPHIGIYFNKAK